MGSPVFQGRYDYPGGVATSTVTGMSAPPLPTGGIDPDLLMRLINKREAERDQDRALQLRALQAAVPQRQEMIPVPQAPRSRGRPIFTKTVGHGPQGIPGQVRLNQWEPGAAFAGYEEDLGSGPASASFQGGGGGGGGGPLPGSATPGFFERIHAQRLAEQRLSEGPGGTPLDQARMGAALDRSNQEIQERAMLGMNRFAPPSLAVRR